MSTFGIVLCPGGAAQRGAASTSTIGGARRPRRRLGLPAENAAIKNKTAPGKWTRANIEHMRGQLQTMGYAIDWTRELGDVLPRGRERLQRWTPAR